MITAEQAAQELLARRRARANFPDFIQYVNPAYQFQWFHRVLAEKLQQWYEGSIRNLIVNMPPRNGKSEQCSRLLPAFIFGNDPNAHIIATSYSSDLARLLNRDVQRIIDSPRYRNLFPRTCLNTRNVRSDAQGSYLRNTDIFEIVGYRGQYRSTGRGGGVTGMGGKFLIVDDPIKDKEEARSSVIKEAAYNWLTTTFFSRQADDTARKLIIATRWAYDDPVGRLLDLSTPGSDTYDPNAETWEIVTFPALAYDYDDPARSPEDKREPGEPLWPTKFSKRFLLAFKANNAEDFEAIQQQRPVSSGNAIFERHWFKIVKATPNQAVRVRYWDKAGTADGGAYTVGTLLAFDGVNYYIEDVIRKQLAYSEREALIKQTAILDNMRYGSIQLENGLDPITTFIEQEPGSGGLESAERTILMLAPFSAYKDRVIGDKTIRANGVSAQAKAGNIFILEADWNEGWLNRVTQFPKGKFKDEVDSLSGAFNKLSLGWEQVYTFVEDVYKDISVV
jgi:predicted phage terminase large subunit-like protein